MPSFLELDGLRVYRPGVYATIDASSLGGAAGVSTGNIALVGNFPQFEHDTPVTFLNARDLVDYAPNDSEIALLAKIAFSPSDDPNVGGGASALTFLNVNTNAQASVTADDGAGDDAITFKSRVWGAQGNRTRVTITNNAADNSVDITASRNGATEVFKNLGGLDLAKVYYSGSSLGSVSLDSHPTNGVQVSWQKTFTGDTWPISGAADLEDMLVDNSTITLTPNTDGGEASDIVIVGTDAAGAAQTETFTGVADGASETTANSYSSITSITVTLAGGVAADADDNLVVASTAFNLLPADYDYLVDMLRVINDTPNFVVDFLEPRLIPSNEVDEVSDTDIVGLAEAAALTANNYLVRQGLSSSLLITASRATNATKGLAQHGGGTTATLSLAGGSETDSAAVTPADYEAGLQEIEDSDIQIVVPFSSDIDVLTKVKEHLPLAARAGRERNAWMGTTSAQTLANVRANFVNKMNDRNIAIVAQDIKVTRPDGRTAQLGPQYLALMLAAMQAGTPVGTPLTRKRPGVTDVVTTNWHPNRDAATAIQYGIVNLSYDSQGWRVERSVTSYLTDDNPIYSEVSANESANASVRTLRIDLDRRIGERVLSSSRAAIEALVKQNLEQQVRDTVIKAFKDISVQDLGDTFRVNYTMAAIEPLNFIRVAATVVRIPS
jgi:hypothetical protein